MSHLLDEKKVPVLFLRVYFFQSELKDYIKSIIDVHSLPTFKVRCHTAAPHLSDADACICNACAKHSLNFGNTPIIYGSHQCLKIKKRRTPKHFSPQPSLIRNYYICNVLAFCYGLFYFWRKSKGCQRMN